VQRPIAWNRGGAQDECLGYEAEDQGGALEECLGYEAEAVAVRPDYVFSPRR
jgi:hypothetical protein